MGNATNLGKDENGDWVPMGATKDSNGNPVGGVVVAKGDTEVIASAVTSTGAQTAASSGGLNLTFQATLSNTTAPTATVDIEVSNDNSQWIIMGTIALSGASDTDGFVSSASWKYVRANVTDISGVSAAVTVTMGG